MMLCSRMHGYKMVTLDGVLKDALLENGDTVAWISCLRPDSSTQDGSTHDRFVGPGRH